MVQYVFDGFSVRFRTCAMSSKLINTSTKMKEINIRIVSEFNFNPSPLHSHKARIPLLTQLDKQYRAQAINEDQK